MTETYFGGGGKKYYTSAQIKKIQKQMKKSYKKAEKIKKISDEVHKEEQDQADKMLNDL